MTPSPLNHILKKSTSLLFWYLKIVPPFTTVGVFKNYPSTPLTSLHNLYYIPQQNALPHPLTHWKRLRVFESLQGRIVDHFSFPQQESGGSIFQYKDWRRVLFFNAGGRKGLHLGNTVDPCVTITEKYRPHNCYLDWIIYPSCVENVGEYSSVKRNGDICMKFGFFKKSNEIIIMLN